MKAGRSVEMNAVRNGGDTRGGVQSRNGGEIRSGGNTRADASDPEPDKNGYVGVEKKKFVAGDVLHFMVALTEADFWTPKVSNATLQADGTTWLFDTPLVLPKDATKTNMIEVFYDARYILMNDIDLTPKDGPAIGKGLNGIDDLLASHPEQLWTPIGKEENTPFTAEGNLAKVYTLLVNNTGGDITNTDVGGGDDGFGTTHGQLKTIPPGALYTVKREWTASGIWGGSNIPGSLTVVLPRIDWTYNRE